MCQTRPTLYTRNTAATVQIPNPNGARQVIPDPNAPKFFPMAQALGPSTQFAEGLAPATPMPYPFQVRRMVSTVQPVIARRDVRFSTPTPIMISKKVPIGLPVNVVMLPLIRIVETAKETKKDGRTSPDVLSTNEDTWDFWDRVYSDPELRQSMQERQRDSPMAELLHSDKLCKAQVVFLNVPRLAYGQQHVVRSLIHREINSNLPILDIHITYRKWTVRFYRSEDAVQVLRHFNGFSFRNHKLLVRACQNNSSFGDAAALEEAAQQENEERRVGSGASSEIQRPDYDSLWTLTEWKDIMEFKKDLIAILEGKQTGMVLNEALCSELCQQRLIRILLPEVKAIGRCACLAGHEDMAALVRRAAQESSTYSAIWQRSLDISGLSIFIIDIPLRFASEVTGPALAEWATKLVPFLLNHQQNVVLKRSYQFIVMFEVLYLASSIRHRRILVEAVQPLSSLKFKFMNPTGRC
ncbi:hypothetical protein COOONC_19383 [Cooperia oncophora]